MFANFIARCSFPNIYIYIYIILKKKVQVKVIHLIKAHLTNIKLNKIRLKLLN